MDNVALLQDAEETIAALRKTGNAAELADKVPALRRTIERIRSESIATADAASKLLISLDYLNQKETHDRY